MQPIIIVVLIGALGGLVRAFLGYKVQSDTNEKFDWIKMLKSMIRAAIAGAIIVYNTVDVSNPSVNLYIGAFFTSVGGEVIMKELYGTVINKK